MNIVSKIFINKRIPRYLEEFSKRLSNSVGYIFEVEDFEQFVDECRDYIKIQHSAQRNNLVLDVKRDDDGGVITVHAADANRYEGIIRIKYIRIKGNAGYSVSGKLQYEPFLV